MRFVYLMVFGFVGLTALYLMISVYSRSVRREKLEKHWDELHPDSEPDERSTYIEAGMTKYERGFRRKLIVLVYVVPVIAVALTLYLNN